MESTQRWTASAVGVGAPSASVAGACAAAGTRVAGNPSAAGHRSVFGPARIAVTTPATPVLQDDQVLGMGTARTYVRTDKFTGPASGPPV